MTHLLAAPPIRRWLWLGVLWAALACEDPPAQKATATAAPLAPAKPATASALSLEVEPGTSFVEFPMDAPLEKIVGEAPGSLEGELFVDLADLRRSTGLVTVDLDRLELFQQKRRDEKEELGERRKNALQNSHARDWLEIEPREGQLSEADARKNRFVEFKLDALSDLSHTNVLELQGGERRVTAVASGDFRLHGRQARKNARLELSFRFSGDQLREIQIKSLEPVVVKLEEFDVHPRDAAGKVLYTLSEALTGKLKNKVTSDAPVSFRFTAKPR